MWEGTARSGSSRAKASPGHGHHRPLRQAGSSLSVPAPPHQGQPRGHSACASHPHSQREAEAQTEQPRLNSYRLAKICSQVGKRRDWGDEGQPVFADDPLLEGSKHDESRATLLEGPPLGDGLRARGWWRGSEARHLESTGWTGVAVGRLPGLCLEHSRWSLQQSQSRGHTAGAALVCRMGDMPLPPAHTGVLRKGSQQGGRGRGEERRGRQWPPPRSHRPSAACWSKGPVQGRERVRSLDSLPASMPAGHLLLNQPPPPWKPLRLSSSPDAKARPYPSPAPSCCLAQCQCDTSWFIFHQGTLVPPVDLVQGPGGLTQPQPARTEWHLLSMLPAVGTATEANWMVPVHLSN